MANGIDWFRWHHGSVNDPKFGLVAKKAGARVGDVVAVWVLMLEQASANTERGVVGAVDCEATDFLLDADEGTTARILEAMQSRALLEGGRVTRWEHRQPKRERLDNTSTDRKRAQRERDKAPDDVNASVTPSHAKSHQVTPREEKSREEEKKEPRSKTKTPAASTFDPLPDLIAQGVAPQTATDWLALRKTKRATVTPTALNNMVAEASRAGMSLGSVLTLCCSRGWAGFEADWVLKDQRAGPLSAYHARQANSQTLIDRISRKKKHEPEPLVIDIN